MGLRPKKLVLFFGVAAVLALVGSLIFALRQPVSPAPPLPNPNGYVDLVKAGKMLPGEISDYRTLSEERLRALVATNIEVFKLARTGLARESCVPPDYSPSLSVHFADLSPLKRLGQGFAAESKVAEADGDFDRAAKSALDGVMVGYASARGGLIIDALVGVAIEAMHTALLEKVAPRLSAKSCRELVTALEAAEAARDNPEKVFERERDWVRRAYGLRGQITRLLSYRSYSRSEQALTGKIRAQHKRSRQLILVLAARAYEVEKAHAPASVSDLVPAYLKAIPRDPYTGTNMVLGP